MTDFFALLDVPRRPWIEAKALKEKFLAMSAQVHPDRVHEAGDEQKRIAHEQFTQLNAAYGCLSEPRSRLQHLVELETGVKPSQVKEIAPGLMEMFQAVANICKQADMVIREKEGTSSPLLKARLFDRAERMRQELMELGRQVDTGRDALAAELKEVDRGWLEPMSQEAVSRKSMLRQLDDIYRRYSYLNRWAEQIRERLLRLAI
jgi:curved DNA-binding protein CbpA